MNRVCIIGKVKNVKKEGIYELRISNGKSFDVVVCLFGEKKDKLAKYITADRKLAVEGKLAQSKQGELYIVAEQIDFLDAPQSEFKNANPEPQPAPTPEPEKEDDDVPF